MSCTSLRKGLPVLASMLALMLGACSPQGGPDDRSNDPGDSASADEFGRPVPATTVPPDDAGDFFTWEQDRARAGDEARVATTTRASAYFTALSARYGGYVEPAWPSISSPDFARALRRPRQGNEWLLRGPVRVRLVRVEVSGGTAATTVCEDSSKTEGRATPDSAWKPSTDPGVAVSATRYERSTQSPTGWAASGPGATAITAQQCQQLLAQPAAVVQRGPIDLPAD